MDMLLTNREKAILTHEALKRRKEKKIKEARDKYMDCEGYKAQRACRFKKSVYY